MTHDQFVAVLQALTPGAKWALIELDLTWHDGVQTEPTQQEIDDKFAELYP